MSDELKVLNEEVKKTFEALKEHNDKAIKEAETRNGEATAETRVIVDKLNTEITNLQGQIKELETRANRPNIPAEGANDDNPEMEVRKAAFNKFLRHGIGETGRASYTPEETRALSSASDADGGFLIPNDFETDVIMNAYDMSALRPICQVGTTSRDTVTMGSLSKPSVAWGRQNIAVTAQTLQEGAERITIYDLRALTLISNNTLDDSAADIWGELSGAFSMAVSEAEDDAFAVGAGDDSPKGVVADSRVLSNSTNSGVAAALSDSSNNGVDALIGVMYTPKKVYRRNGTWAMNSTTESEVRKLKDGDGQYLWQPSVQAGVPPTLLGRPIVNPEGMPDIAADAYPIVFGDFRKGYKIRDRAGLTIQRLVERYAEYDQTGFMIKRRVGGQVTLAEAFAVLKISA